MNDKQKEKHSILFFQLVLLFQSSALQQLGKIANPASGKIEKDLTQASTSIDILDMLLHKCKGNLTDDEQRFLEHALSELKLNYVDEVNRDSDSGNKDNQESKPENDSVPPEQPSSDK